MGHFSLSAVFWFSVSVGEIKFQCYNKHVIQLSCLIWYDTYGA